ncbi:hypothetical protein HPB50_023946 [Hyalomma asiaticum]|uniref:Uncharacterized protein n=1 Tax=Hyalomma asiaticum TaxID=266040 RepID=A0ACB7S1S7_HYAAI|nr:hypothetical protein HPB50_023946 [Hyalomma asiaticum]
MFQVLTDSYGQKDLLIDEHIYRLLAIEPIESSSQVSRLRDLSEQIRFSTNCFDSLGRPSAEYAVVLSHVLMRSLPEDLAILFRKGTKTDTGVTDSADQSRYR